MQKRHILVVEDDEDISELVAYNLVKAGYRVTRAATGREALARVAEEPPDLVVLDLMLPETDGTEVCRRLKGDANTSAIPACTACRIICRTRASLASIAGAMYGRGLMPRRWIAKPTAKAMRLSSLSFSGANFARTHSSSPFAIPGGLFNIGPIPSST